MNAVSQPSAIARASDTEALTRALNLAAVPPALRKRDPAPRRTKIWEFAGNLHCSIIGTCLSTTELRSVLRKLGVSVGDCSDRDLHKRGVGLASRHDESSRQLHKALDQRHKLALHQFAKAGTEAELLRLWHDAVQRGDIPSAYWATLTHPAATQAVISEAFGDVHMLSHLVGSANRADIKRLCLLEAEKAMLEAKIERQQLALHHAITTRDAQINALRQALGERVLSRPEPDSSALLDLAADRERHWATEARRREVAEERLATALAERERERSARIAAEAENAALQVELQAAEMLLSATPDAAPSVDLRNATLLYVGGRPRQIAHLRQLVEGAGGGFLHHDGGLENHQALLSGLVRRCDVALFPVNCISHDAVITLKALCRKAGKRFLPLRSASAAALFAAVQQWQAQAAADCGA